MKKAVLILMAAMIITLSACGKGDKAESTIETGGNTSLQSSEFVNSDAVESQQTETTSSIESTEAVSSAAVESKSDKADAKIPSVYKETIDKYTAALTEKWNGGKLMENDLNYMMSDCYGDAPFKNIGYAIADIDNNGTMELIVGTTASVKDEFFEKMIFDLYTVDSNGSCIKVFSSGERNRYYYAGGNRFANIGSSGADSSFETTVKLEGDEMIDMTHTTDVSKYVQMELNLFQ